MERRRAAERRTLPRADERSREPDKEIFTPPPRRRTSDAEREQHVDEPLPELLEVLPERHRSLLVGRNGLRGRGHGLRGSCSATGVDGDAGGSGADAARIREGPVGVDPLHRELAETIEFDGVSVGVGHRAGRGGDTRCGLSVPLRADPGEIPSDDRPELVDAARQAFGPQDLVDPSLPSYLGRHVAQPADPLAECPEHLRETPRPDHDQRDDGDQHDFAEGDAEHARERSPIGLSEQSLAPGGGARCHRLARFFRRSISCRTARAPMV